ncbi:vitamin B6 photo-protection and homoeostasis-domain-containing protein [Crepidotus variabilis]|uniref:Vitamin B6 photo-protection and homoeostasis-domain-containing protein n=1 Tax=Crepidotus variabilis TaxID=179855 RepID=A0A9P6JPI6_9AGAR|nr:vitamin B6 photo-protection and homoeostasis-domain-containing protein [Crepidotus variabilis]
MAKTVLERDLSGQTRQILIDNEKLTVQASASETGAHRSRKEASVAFLKRVFLPSGYPITVSPDYVRYQWLNALQAFCNSLASLLSSRAILQGFGVGDPHATATHAMLLTILQDIFSRLTTICAAHLLGTSLYPEAKKYRLLADILNDFAVVLDTFSPFFASLAVPGLRVGALCLSAGLKSLCGICAGGSKAAITLHFANPVGHKGDVGDLNAKDSSKETVLALLGSLLGTVVVPHLTSPAATYAALFVLIALHLLINYLGVKGLALRTLNKQRLTIAWLFYCTKSDVPLADISAKFERIFLNASSIIDPQSGVTLGECVLGSSVSRSMTKPIPPELFDLFEREKYLIWYENHAAGCSHPRVHIYLKDKYTSNDLLKAWVHAVEVCRTVGQRVRREHLPPKADYVKDAYLYLDTHFSFFLSKLRAADWDTVESALMTGGPTAIITDVTFAPSEDRKRR